MGLNLKIKVTKDILERSKWCSTSKGKDGPAGKNCAIALAVRDIFPNAWVGTEFILFNAYDGESLFFSNTGSRAALPKIAIDFIAEFDENSPSKRGKMNPIEFEIEIPEPVIESINISEITKLLENHPTLELINA